MRAALDGEGAVMVVMLEPPGMVLKMEEPPKSSSLSMTDLAHKVRLAENLGYCIKDLNQMCAYIPKEILQIFITS